MHISNSSLHDNDVEADDNDVAAVDAKNGDPTSVASELLRHSSNITL